MSAYPLTFAGAVLMTTRVGASCESCGRSIRAGARAYRLRYADGGKRLHHLKCWVDSADETARLGDVR